MRDVPATRLPNVSLESQLIFWLSFTIVKKKGGGSGGWGQGGDNVKQFQTKIQQMMDEPREWTPGFATCWLFSLTSEFAFQIDCEAILCVCYKNSHHLPLTRGHQILLLEEIW